MSIQTASSAGDFAAGHDVIDWTLPETGELVNLPCAVDRQLARWRRGAAVIEIDIDGPPASISYCGRKKFPYNFALGASALLADNRPGRMPLHLRFLTPMRSVGAEVSAIGTTGRPYEAQCDLVLDDHRWMSIPSRPAAITLSRKQSSAPFMGATAMAGRVITDVWFDAIDPADQENFLRIAISDLHFVPA